MAKLVLVISLVCGLFLYAEMHTALAQNSDPSVDLVVTETGEGGTVRVDVVANNVQNVGAFEFVLGFDQDAVAVETVNDLPIMRGPFLGSSGREVLCDPVTLESVQIRYSCKTLGPEPARGADGSGVLATIFFSFHGDVETTPLVFTGEQLATPPGEEIVAEWRSSQIGSSGGGSSKLWIAIAVVLFAAIAILGSAAALMIKRRAAATAERTPFE